MRLSRYVWNGYCWTFRSHCLTEVLVDICPFYIIALTGSGSLLGYMYSHTLLNNIKYMYTNLNVVTYSAPRLYGLCV
jgi:hypothetical protein